MSFFQFYPPGLEPKPPTPEVRVEKTPIVSTVKHGFKTADSKPPHYNQNSEIECIDAIKASMTPIEFQGYCKGNALKYIWRFRDKGGLEDLYKGYDYWNWLIESIEEES